MIPTEKEETALCQFLLKQASRYSTLRLMLDPWFCYTDAVTQPLVLEPRNTPREVHFEPPGLRLVRGVGVEMGREREWVRPEGREV